MIFQGTWMRPCLKPNDCYSVKSLFFLLLDLEIGSRCLFSVFWILLLCLLVKKKKDCQKIVCLECWFLSMIFPSRISRSQKWTQIEQTSQYSEDLAFFLFPNLPWISTDLGRDMSCDIITTRIEVKALFHSRTLNMYTAKRSHLAINVTVKDKTLHNLQTLKKAAAKWSVSGRNNHKINSCTGSVSTLDTSSCVPC